MGFALKGLNLCDIMLWEKWNPKENHTEEKNGANQTNFKCLNKSKCWL